MPHLLAQWEQLKDPGIVGLVAFAGLVGAAIGALITWLATLREMNREDWMAGLKALEATHKPRDEYSKSCIALGNSVRKLADQIKSMRSADPNGPPQQKLVVDARDNCCSYLSRVIDVGRNMFEFELLVANQNGGKEQKIIDDVVTQLGKIARWLRAINLQVLLKEIDCTAFALDDGTMKKFTDMANNVDTSIRDYAKSQLSKAVQGVLDSGRSISEAEIMATQVTLRFE